MAHGTADHRAGDERAPVPERTGRCPRCGAARRDGDRFCKDCGQPLAHGRELPRPPRCPGCGVPHRAGDRFCRGCGRARSRAAAAVRLWRTQRTSLAATLCALLAAGGALAAIHATQGARRAATPAPIGPAPVGAPAPSLPALTLAQPRARRPNPKPRRPAARPRPTTPPATSTPALAPSAATLHLAAALALARAEQAAGHRIGFALVSADGQTLAQVNPTEQTYSGSISKAMLLVAYLRQASAEPLSDAARAELTAMIEVSDNDAADWVYTHLSAAQHAVAQVAADAGMTGFQLDTSDPVYVLGQSLISAADFARLFARIDELMPTAQTSFGMYLLSHVQERVGLLDAGLPGVVYAKEGWKPEPPGLLGAPYIVNQAAQFSYQGATYGVAVTVGTVSDQTDGEAIVRQIVGALL
jgi:hypothetical protein